MDYTTLTRVLEILGATSTSDDALVGRLITEASRWIDRYCSGKIGVDDYFKREVIADEELSGYLDGVGTLLCYPLKPRVWSVSAISIRTTPGGTWASLDVTRAAVSGNYGVLISTGLAAERIKVWARMSYDGGLFETAEEIPGDLQNAADLLAVRFYREAKSSLSDSIGVAELGTLIYTKAIPARVAQMLAPYRRWIT